jgi:hypothetical protein
MIDPALPLPEFPVTSAAQSDENADTRCCAGVGRTLGIVPVRVKNFLTVDS